jgi:hypothetical protein
VFSPAPVATPRIAAGILRVIATTGAARSALFLDFEPSPRPAYRTTRRSARKAGIKLAN